MTEKSSKIRLEADLEGYRFWVEGKLVLSDLDLPRDEFIYRVVLPLVAVIQNRHKELKKQKHMAKNRGD